MSEHQADIFPRPSHYIMFVVLGCAGFVCLSLISVIRMNQPDGSFQNTELSTNLPIFIVPISGLLVAAFGSRRAVETPRKTAVFRFAAIGSAIWVAILFIILLVYMSSLEVNAWDISVQWVFMMATFLMFAWAVGTALIWVFAYLGVWIATRRKSAGVSK